MSRRRPELDVVSRWSGIPGDRPGSRDWWRASLDEIEIADPGVLEMIAAQDGVALAIH
jgi:hypothetical protein